MALEEFVVDDSFWSGLRLALGPEYRWFFLGRVALHLVELGGIAVAAWAAYVILNRHTSTDGITEEEEEEA